MTEPEDPFDTWLHRQVNPLRPPPGTFDQIRKRARRRKTRRAMMSAASAGAAAAVIVVAVVAVPKLVPSLHSAPKPAANSSPSTPKFSPSQTATSTSRLPSSTTPTNGIETATVPSDLAPTSVTFVNFSDGWVIGQAPGCGETYCTSVAETSNYGKNWKPIAAPPAGAPEGSTGVSQIRFLNASDGWAFGPQLYETHNGGQNWTEIDTFGMRVTSLETVGNMAYAVFAACTGSGADFAADCTKVSVYSAPMGSDTWTPMTGLTGFGFNRGYVSGKLVLTPSEGYFYAPDGLLYSGVPTQGTSWQPVAEKPVPCQPSNAQPDGQPSGGQLAASVAGHLVVACPGANGSNQELIYASTDGGLSWVQQATLTVKGSATSLAASINNTLTLATTGGIYVSTNGGPTWTLAEVGPPGGFSYVGMTSSLKGIAVPAEPAQSNSVWYTYDGGAAWTQSSLTNP